MNILNDIIIENFNSILEYSSLFSWISFIIFVCFGFFYFLQAKKSSKLMMMFIFYLCFYFFSLYITFEIFSSDIFENALGVISIFFIGIGGHAFYFH